MFSWWKKSIPAQGLVFFRNAPPCTLHEFDYLREMGITITEKPGDAQVVWRMSLHHPEWGDALVACPRESHAPPREVVMFSPSLTSQDQEAVLAAQSAVVIEVTAKHGNVLKDRKLALRYFNAIIGDDGLAVMDALSQLFWTREMLADELAHDADLDVEALYCLHAITNEGEDSAFWIHSHGLKEIGFFDFSIIKPHSDIQPDLYRSIAFGVVEGTATVGSHIPLTLMPPKDALLLAMRDFLEQGDPAAVAVIKDGLDEEHIQQSAVLCEPPGGGWFRRLFAKGIQPSQTLSRSFPENGVMPFSHAATELMAARARDTFDVFRRYSEEFTGLGLPFPMLAKIGYGVDGGGPQDLEHLWFLVKGFQDDAVDAELVNQPFNIAHLNEGDRGVHPITGLSDWTIMTPLGPITPRNASPMRALRALDPHILEDLRQKLQEYGQ